MSSEGAAESPQRAPRELLRSVLRAYMELDETHNSCPPPEAPRELPRSFLGANMELGEAQKSSPEALKSLENDLKIKNVEFHETIEHFLKIIDFSSSESQL